MQKPYKLRDNNKDYMEKVRVWYEKIYEQVKGLFYQDGGNIIGIQFENELTDNAEHTERLPLSPHYVFDTTRNDSAIGRDLIAEVDADGWRLPYENYPFATCELGGGMQVTHHRRPRIKGMDIYALSLVKLGSGKAAFWENMLSRDV